MEELQENEYSGKTVEEAIETGLKTLGITKEEAEITVLEEGKKKIFGSVKAKVKVCKKQSDGERAIAFIDGLMDLLKIPAFNEVVGDGEKIEIEIKTTNTAAVIGRRGEVLDAIQCIAGAVANIGRDEYKRVVVDCENYRADREAKLQKIALGKAKKAIETSRRVKFEPMSPYERRVIHSALAEVEGVTTVSEGKEPVRRVVIIPDNEKPYERKPYGGRGDRRPYDRDRRPQGGRQFNRDKRYGEGGYNRDRRPYNKDGEGKEGYNRKEGYNNDRNGGYNRDRRPYDRDRRPQGDRGRNPRPRGKKEIYFGAYLGNSGANKEPATTDDKKED